MDTIVEEDAKDRDNWRGFGRDERKAQHLFTCPGRRTWTVTQPPPTHPAYAPLPPQSPMPSPVSLEQVFS
ncbi:hypothetical protein E2C01_086418 [Portunus trituberculatus]|uniref:Uncharacterized protein n=1 Tax=Portunus trituberculatus TaxID=210409 RepID=A0A5B7JG98_PORTR|nr:hypothetical protein [Portunus trituberculatus]